MAVLNDRNLNRIKNIDFKGSEGTSVVNFEKPSAVSTALLVCSLTLAARPHFNASEYQLNGGTLEGAQITVTAEEPEEEAGGDSFIHHKAPVSQADKPRAGSESTTFISTGNHD